MSRNPNNIAPPINEQTRSLMRNLPDPESARFFHEQFVAEHPRAARQLARDAALLSDVLALAAWSPLLATTLQQQPEHVAWLARERADTQVRTAEAFGESLARFALTHTQVSPAVLLSRFRRRELLGIYLHDIRRLHSVVETTEQLSNLADAILAYALDLARQELDNRHGAPLAADERGRTTAATFCVVALGKLGSRELNYASDIDLLFLYSDDGETSGAGERGATSNREYFNKLAEKIAQLTGRPAGEGAAYRVDLRLRPHGRDGALSCSLAEALRYYQQTAQAWELQALIRARAAAGDAALYARFADGVRGRIYTQASSIEQALLNVRLAKQKIDSQHERDARGFNVKLGRGGIREIEFIAQALQLAHGAHDTWLQHAPHTLVSLGRLADRVLVTEAERADLSDAYAFLRCLEHRLQMEHGLQTHVLPDDPQKRALVARRMGFAGEMNALASFDHALEHHVASVRAAFARVFGNATATTPGDVPRRGMENPLAAGESQLRAAATAARPEFGVEADAETAAWRAAAALLAPRFDWEHADDVAAVRVEQIFKLLRAAAQQSLNARRAATLTARVAASLGKSNLQITLTETDLRALVRLCGASELFGEMIESSPALLEVLTQGRENADTIAVERDYRAMLRAAIDREKTYGAELCALRRAWAQLLLERGTRDAAGEMTLRESNEFQTALATAAINAAYLIARRELARRYGKLAAGPRLAVFGLGRLGSGGMDYGSDLDLVLIYDPLVPSPLARHTHDEAYARIAELMTTALSSLTRDGYLYRVDLRLRPDGRNGPLVRGSQSFLNYLRDSTNVWEWLAYVKLRAAGGDLELGTIVEREARRLIHERALAADPEELRQETRRVRERLERERGAGRGARYTDIKFGAGGMLDVYFATRYLQLRDDVRDEGDDRSTPTTLERLRRAGSVTEEDYRALSDGYALLRRLDHFLRLIAGRSSHLPAAPDHPLLRDLARLAGHDSPAVLTGDLAAHMTAIRVAYDRITKPDREEGARTRRPC
ncbi:MAG: hypothetical protein H0T45_11760 [Pyrinomonadaceae bacterium]|nr:hypothetical protein [Pyrinomonadaceae bacterium]